MSKIVRNIIKIDQDKCNGCGLCVKACAEGAIQIVNGKAKLISEVYCDGLGACIGDCPQGAIEIERREAAPFDVAAVEKHLAQSRKPEFSCPGMQAKSLAAPHRRQATEESAQPSRLSNWPVQLALLPVHAPYLHGAELVLSADCAPAACGDFHRKFMGGKILCIACPKLDDTGKYVEKLSQIIAANALQSIDIVYMEVPCCRGLVGIVEAARTASGQAIPVNLIKVSLQGEVISRDRL